MIPRSTATRWGQTWREQGRAQALPTGGDQRSGKLEAHAPEILALVEAKPDMFLDEIVAALAARDIATSRDAVRRLLLRHGITRKKRPSLPANRSARTSSKRVRNGERR